MRLVIIDDDKQQLQMFAMVLASLRKDWQVEQILATEEWAVAALTQGTLAFVADVVLMDFRFEHRDSLALIPLCSSLAPVVLMSGSVDPSIEAQGLAAGAHAVVAKPLSAAQAEVLLDACAQCVV